MRLQVTANLNGKNWVPEPDLDLDSENTLVLIFGASEYMDAPEPITELVAWFPKAHLLGCSTAGEIYGAGVQDHSISVAVAQFQRSKLRTQFAPIRSSKDSFAAGKALAEGLVGEDLSGVLVLSEGTWVNGSELVRGLNEILPQHVVVTGGLAGDGERFERTWIIERGGLQTGQISAVGFYGEHIQIGHGSMGGWDIFGPERRVTASEGSVLYELDGKPALQLYKEYLGERATGLPATALLFPLSLRENRDDEHSVVRTVLAVDEGRQSMIFAGDIPQGHLAQLMKANFDRLIDGAGEAARKAKDTQGEGFPVLSIAISCVGRRLVLGGRTEEELEAVLEVLPPDTQQVGFYSYGEISPHLDGCCDLHNQTMTLTTLCES
jgi:hypothetical protein